MFRLHLCRHHPCREQPQQPQSLGRLLGSRHTGSGFSKGTQELFVGHTFCMLGQMGKAEMTGSPALRIFRAQRILDFRKQETGSLLFLKGKAVSQNAASRLAGWWRTRRQGCAQPPGEIAYSPALPCSQIQS